METITITIPKKMLANRYRTKRLILAKPEDLTKEARRQWEMEDAREASRQGHKEWREGRTREISDLKELM